MSCNLYPDLFYDAVRRYDCWIWATSSLCFCRKNVDLRFPKHTRHIRKEQQAVGLFVQGELEGT